MDSPKARRSEPRGSRSSLTVMRLQPPPAQWGRMNHASFMTDVIHADAARVGGLDQDAGDAARQVGGRESVNDLAQPGDDDVVDERAVRAVEAQRRRTAIPAGQPEADTRL